MNVLLLGLQFLAGFVFLVGGAELLVRGASRLAKRFNVPEVVIGLTVVAFGTSLPELVVSLTASLGGTSALAVGNVVGSNIANLGLILGICGLIAVLRVDATFPRREIPALLGVTVALHRDGLIRRHDRAAGRSAVGRRVGGVHLLELPGRHDRASVSGRGG